MNGSGLLKILRHAELVSATSSLAKNEPYEDGVPLGASHNLEIPNAADCTLPCNSRFARKQEELQVRDDVRRIGTPDLSQIVSL
ncbi:MAG: hypothetical protein WC197_06900 [Candidatus Gastranaerophilaceae bacterium]